MSIVPTSLSGKPASRKQALRIAGAALAVVLLAGGISAGNSWLPPATAKGTPAKVVTVPVVVGRVAVRDLPIWLSGIGTVTPLNVVDVKVRVDGELQHVAFSEGQEVAADHVLAQIDPRPYKAALAQAEANRQKDLAQLDNSHQEAVRAGKLASAGAGTAQNLDAARAQAAALKATVAADEAAIDAARLNLEFTRIRSPIAGRVGMRQINPGTIVHANDSTGLVTVTQMAPISVLFSVPQDALEALVAGQRDGPLPVAVFARNGTKRVADGSLVFINSTVDQTNGQIQLKAVFDNLNRELWPGEFVSARLLVRTDRDAMAAPAQAILTGEHGLYVYLLTSDQTVEARNVTTGPTVDGFTEILTGLTPGDEIVLDGQSRLAPGMRVTILPDTSPSPTATRNPS